MLGRQKGQTDLASREGDIRVRYASSKTDVGRRKRVVMGDIDSKMPEAAWSYV